MDSPYRSSPTSEVATRPRDAGIVGDIIDQFSDRFAFYRELIQNSIDAETETIEVSIRYEDQRKTLIVSVVDHGMGMPKEVIEEKLLVLFRSSKEQDESKIGKFGIGFVSVFAIQPTLVRVISNHAGMRHTLHLYPDLSYELFDSGRIHQTGTCVELEIPMNPEGVKDFAQASLRALNRWCRHASAMITLEAYGPGDEKLLGERIDRPLSLDEALVSIERCTTDGALRAVVGISDLSYSGFFNHGLMLYETSRPIVAGLSFVVQDARLGHTLSRDNVRRDAHYERVLDFVRDLGEALNAEVPRALRDAVLHVDRDLYQKIASAVHRAKLDIAADEWPLPLVDPIDSNHSIDVEAFLAAGAWLADAPSLLTATLARARIPAVHQDWVIGSNLQPFSWFRDRCQYTRHVALHLTLASSVLLSPSDLVFLDLLAETLDRSYRRPSQVLLASLSGLQCSALSVAGGPSDALVSDGCDHWVLDNSRALRNPFRSLRRPALVLNADCFQLQAARQVAESDPLIAAQTITRLLLLDREKLDVKRSEKLLVEGLTSILRGSP